MQCKFVQIIEETKKLDFTQQVTYYFVNILLVGINLAHHHQLPPPCASLLAVTLTMSGILFVISIQLILLSSGNPSEKISDFVAERIKKCNDSISKCQNNEFFYSDVTQISPSWFAFATTIDIPMPSPAPGWQGAIFYKVITKDHLIGTSQLTVLILGTNFG